MSFAKDRQRRANAGNRMRALLAQEIDMEELFEESISDDEEFVTKPEDEVVDTFDSDFEIESSEEEREQEELGRQEDRQIALEERQARRTVHKTFQLPKPKSLQPAKQKEQKPAEEQRKVRRRQVSVHDTTETGVLAGTRQSSRSTTIRSRLHVEEQIREYELKKAQLPRRDRPVVKRMTQEELLAEAEITERKNRESLEQWQQKEAEKKAKAKKKEANKIKGPFVRYYSYTDGRPDQRPKRRKIIMISSTPEGKNVQTEITDPEAIAWQEKLDFEDSDMVGRNLISFLDYRPEGQTSESLTGLSDRDLDKADLIPMLEPWSHRPSRPANPIYCPVTGLPARYRHPKTLIPYANAEAYKVIQACLNHDMVWYADMGIFVGEPCGATGVPDNWEQAMRGQVKSESKPPEQRTHRSTESSEPKRTRQRPSRVSPSPK